MYKRWRKAYLKCHHCYDITTSLH